MKLKTNFNYVLFNYRRFSSTVKPQIEVSLFKIRSYMPVVYDHRALVRFLKNKIYLLQLVELYKFIFRIESLPQLASMWKGSSLNGTSGRT